MVWISQWQSAQLRALYTLKSKANSYTFIYRSVRKEIFLTLQNKCKDPLMQGTLQKQICK